MSTLSSVGATYVAMASASNAVQRKDDATHVATVASPRACCEGEMALQCELMGELQRGCLAVVRLPMSDGSATESEVFLRGGLLLLVADSPSAQLLYCKHPNKSTKHPCPYCTVEQTVEDEGGDLGDPQFDIDHNRRERAHIDDATHALDALAGMPAEQTQRSKELCVVAPGANGVVRPLFDLMAIDQLRHVPVERLHADALNSQGLIQPYLIALLNRDGRAVISGVIRQGSGLYPPGTKPLKDIVSKYSSLTGSHKWLLASILLLVFRPILRSTQSLKSHLKVTELRDLQVEWGPLDNVLSLLQKLVQVASKMTFAVRAPSFNDNELDALLRRARDLVGVYKEVLGRRGVRPSTHSALHYAEAIKCHGIVPDASTGEFSHQKHKRANKSSSGRDPPAHYMRQANTTSALNALANGVPYKVTTYDRKMGTHRHVVVTPGAGCVRVLQGLEALPGGLAGPPDPRAAETTTPAQMRGQYAGAALWRAQLWSAADVPVEDGA